MPVLEMNDLQLWVWILEKTPLAQPKKIGVLGRLPGDIPCTSLQVPRGVPNLRDQNQRKKRWGMLMV